MTQPLRAGLRPGGAGLLTVANTEIVRCPRINVQFGRDAGAFQGLVAVA
jgi:hypothetical protein